MVLNVSTALRAAVLQPRVWTFHGRRLGTSMFTFFGPDLVQYA